MHAVDLHRIKKFKLGKMPLTHQIRYTFLPLNVPAIVYDTHIHVEIGYCALTSQYTVQNVFHMDYKVEWYSNVYKNIVILLFIAVFISL